MHSKQELAIVTIILTAVVLVAPQTGFYPLVGKPAPDISLPTLDGGQFKLADCLGKKMVILDFWATWCPPCQASLPAYAEMTAAYKDVVFCAVNLGESPDDIRAFLKKAKIQCNVALDASGAVGAGLPRRFHSPYRVHRQRWYR